MRALGVNLLFYTAPWYFDYFLQNCEERDEILG
jgi:hypothetical protein